MNKKILLSLSFMVMAVSSYSVNAGAVTSYFLRLNELRENVRKVTENFVAKYPAELKQIDLLCAQLGCTTYEQLPVDIQEKYRYMFDDYRADVTQCVDTYVGKCCTRLRYTMVGLYVAWISAAIAIKLYDYYHMKPKLKESVKDNQSCTPEVDEQQDDASVTDIHEDLAHQ